MALNLVSPPPGGTSGQYLKKDSSTDGDTSWTSGLSVKTYEFVPDYSLGKGGHQYNKMLSESSVPYTAKICGVWPVFRTSVSLSYRDRVTCHIYKLEGGQFFIVYKNDSVVDLEPNDVHFMIAYI